MDINQRLDELSHEMKVLKNEIRQVLLDIREHVLTYYQNAPTAVAKSADESEKNDADGQDELADTEAEKSKEVAGAGGGVPAINVTVQERPVVADRERVETLSSASFRDEPVGNGPDFLDEAAIPRISFDDDDGGDKVKHKGGDDDFTREIRRTKHVVDEDDDLFQMMRMLGGMNGQGNGERGNGGHGMGGHGRGGQGRDMEYDHEYEDQDGYDDGDGADYGPRQQDRGLGQQGYDDGDGANYGPRQQGRRGPRQQGYGGRERGYGPRQMPPGRRLRGNGNGQMDMTTIAMLGRWMNNGVRKVGRKRMETIVEMYQMTGNMSIREREMIVRLARLSDAEEPKGSVPMSACIPIMMQLNTILGGSAQAVDPAVLSMFL